MYILAEAMIAPHVGVGGGIPAPREISDDYDRIENSG
jgi:hypothetical protein